MSNRTIFAIIVHGFPRFAPASVCWQDRIIINPCPEKLLELGYKPVIFAEHGTAPEGYCQEDHWVESDKEIIQVWESVLLPSENERRGADEGKALYQGGVT